MNNNPIKPNRRLLRWWTVLGFHPIENHPDWKWHEGKWMARVALQGWQDAAFTPPTGDEVCVWERDTDDFCYDTTCGEKWQFTNDGPTQNGVVYCQACGRPVALAVEKEEAP